MTTPSHPRQDARSVRSRRALIAAARSLVLDDSVEAVTVSALCQRAEVSRPTFYQHFSSPDELLGAMVGARFDEIFGAIADVDRKDTPALIRRILADVGQDPHTYRGMLGGRPAFSQVRAALEQWLTDRFATNYPDSSPGDVAFAAGGTARLVAIAVMSGGDAAALEQTADDVWRLVRATLAPPRSRGRESTSRD